MTTHKEREYGEAVCGDLYSNTSKKWSKVNCLACLKTKEPNALTRSVEWEKFDFTLENKLCKSSSCLIKQEQSIEAFYINLDDNKNIKYSLCCILCEKYRKGKLVSSLRNKDWELSLEELKEVFKDWKCYYCYIDIRGGSGYSLDRKDNALGYSFSNVVACCGRCNYIKGYDMSYEDMKELSSVIREYKRKKKEQH